MAYCHNHIGEKAAVPKTIYVIDALPSTAVGKVFKPALKCQATMTAVSQLLQQSNINATITSQADDKYGFKVLINLQSNADIPQTQQLLDRLAIYWQFIE